MFNRSLNAQVGLQLRMLDRLAVRDGGSIASARSSKAGLAGTGAAAALLVAPGMAAAQAGCNAGGSSTDGLTTLIQQAANFLIIVGGALAVLMLAVGGFMIMGLGGTSKHSRKGMTIVKNALIGLAIMVAGVFLREVIVKFIAGGTGAGNNSADCLKNDPFGNPNG